MNYNEKNQNETTEVSRKKRGNYKKKTSYITLKEVEIETDLLNKIISVQRAENKKNILNGTPEITIKELLNTYLRAGFENK